MAAYVDLGVIYVPYNINIEWNINRENEFSN